MASTVRSSRQTLRVGDKIVTVDYSKPRKLEELYVELQNKGDLKSLLEYLNLHFSEL